LELDEKVSVLVLVLETSVFVLDTSEPLLAVFLLVLGLDALEVHVYVVRHILQQ
jgi:hypothetical protein